jgi:hypothetical protein
MAIWSQAKHIHDTVPSPYVGDLRAILKRSYQLRLNLGERRQSLD